jgi:hypothetical protein
LAYVSSTCKGFTSPEILANAAASSAGSAYISTAAANQILELMHQYDAKRLNTPSPVLRGPIGK